ncbi:PREDICTED: uncharacterized protein LOC18609619 [Theobroma cacao]|uniref:Uncharacterized protein LOC18609619 n=2 Tax=Theobroma cacao TaxID=3641 RepID=A0AB32VK90_THECC|nr:PREDICTED: uncharacterized protein LOC18609619 [Theobroma cacao]EOY00712.1 Uncharacterized protein TCM_010649 [Theobroma cacao]
MAPRKMKQQALKPKILKKNLKARLQVERLKAETGKIREDQKCIREKQRELRGRFGEIERQCYQLKEATELIVKQTARTQIKLALMFKIMKARRGGDFKEAAMLTRFLRVIVSKERANATSAEVKNEQP